MRTLDEVPTFLKHFICVLVGTL